MKEFEISFWSPGNLQLLFDYLDNTNIERLIGGCKASLGLFYCTEVVKNLLKALLLLGFSAFYLRWSSI